MAKELKKVKTPIIPLAAPREMDEMPPKSPGGIRLPKVDPFQAAVDHCLANPGKVFCIAEGEGTDKKVSSLKKKFPSITFAARIVDGKKGIYATYEPRPVPST